MPASDSAKALSSSAIEGAGVAPWIGCGPLVVWAHQEHNGEEAMSTVEFHG